MIEDISNNCIRKVGNIKVENICAVVFFSYQFLITGAIQMNDVCNEQKQSPGGVL